jgi:hypothetical protein
MSTLGTTIDSINTKSDFVNFIELLLQDFRNNPHEWENKTIDSFLEAASSWTEDMEWYYHNNKLPLPQNVDWQVFANILMAAKMYE